MTMSVSHILPALPPTTREYEQLTTHFDAKHQIAWGYMHSLPRPCFTPTLMTDLIDWAESLRAQIDNPQLPDVSYVVIASKHPGVFSLGGDLSLFHKSILAQDREGLLTYAKQCIDCCYTNLSHLMRPNVTSICLVQGDALGGGFESALSGNVLIAERGSKMGFPEILFNLFPGMGALSLLGRRVGMRKAEQMILSGNTYLAEDLYEMGAVDILAEPGEGAQAVYDYVRKHSRARNGALALRACRERIEPVTYEELMDVTEIWVDAALRIEQKDLRMMERLVARQGGKVAAAAETSMQTETRLAG
jgi:DSF synthase